MISPNMKTLSLQSDLKKQFIGGVVGLLSLTIIILFISHYLNFKYSAN